MDNQPFIPASDQLQMIYEPVALKDKLFFSALSSEIDHLIKNDFEKLVSILYRMDVNESKLRMLLQDENGSDAGELIATLMIERQLQKIESRKKYGGQNPDNDIPSDERW